MKSAFQRSKEIRGRTDGGHHHPACPDGRSVGLPAAYRSIQRHSLAHGASALPDRAAVEDVMQEVWLDVWRGHWTPDGKHLVFVIYTIATNQYRYLVWDAASGKARQTLAIKLPSSVVGKGMLDSLDGHYALIRTNGATPQVWLLNRQHLDRAGKADLSGNVPGPECFRSSTSDLLGKQQICGFCGSQ